MRQDLFIACEQIDAAMFTGDSFLDAQHRVEMCEYINRWTAQLNSLADDDDITGRLSGDQHSEAEK